MKSATVSVTHPPTAVGPGDTSKRIEARLSRCRARNENAFEQRTGSPHIVPHPQPALPARAQSQETAPRTPRTAAAGGTESKPPGLIVSGSRLPGLNGRSVRRLLHLRTVHSARRVLATALSAVAVLVAAGLTAPAYAQAVAEPEQPAPPPQVFTAATSAVVAAVERDGYTATAPPPVQWPTVNHSTISDGFGPRASPCSGCSSNHPGVDILAGWGAEVHAIAAGVVVATNDPFSASLGNHLMIQHEVDGQTLTSVYGHLQYGSTPLSVGDTVKVGHTIGLVGSTGASTGPHLHFEIRINDSAVNPTHWLQDHIT